MRRLKLFMPMLLAVSALACVFACGDGGSQSDVTPPAVSLGEQRICYAEDPYTVVLATARDEVDGEVDVAVEAFAPSGKEVGVSGGIFTPHEVGTYKLIFRARDKAGNVAEKEQPLRVLAPSSKPAIELGDYAPTMREGELYTLPTYSLTEDGKNMDVEVTVARPDGATVEVYEDKFFVDRTGEYTVEFSCTLAAGSVVRREICIQASFGEKTAAGVDGVLNDEMYVGARRTALGGLRDLERINVAIVRGESGIYFAFDGSSDMRVSRNERIEVYFASDEYADSPADGTKKLELFATGEISYRETKSGAYIFAAVPEYYARPVYAVKLGEGTTLDAGNANDGGYASELFVPYEYLGVAKTDSVFLTLGCVREGDPLDWDGWNEFAVFPDPLAPYRYVELRSDGALVNYNRLYENIQKADGVVDDGEYNGKGIAQANVGGLRGLEGMAVRIVYGDDGLYFAFDVSKDKKVNDHDRVEVCLNAGETTRDPNTACLQFWMQSSGGMTVLRGNGDGYIGFEPGSEFPASAATYGDKTTPNKNDDEDNGYYVELFVPYSLFNVHTSARGINKNTRFGITFGIWRASESYHTDLNWSKDPNKDWDGYSHGAFCDPLFPDTYAVLMPDGRIVSRNEVVDIIGDPTDPSVDGALEETYWQSAAKLEIPPAGDLDGVTTLLYRDPGGLRVGFTGTVKELTYKDAIAFYVSTRDSSYEFGGQEGTEKYILNGRYPSEYDYAFHIRFDRSVAAYRGKYKDWADRITDLTAVSLDIAVNDGGYVVEMYIPYAFFTHVPTQEDTLGVTVRLAGENERGSVMWNNLYYAGIYADSESPASYVRLDKNNKLFAGVKNAATARIDGKFDETLYSGGSAELVLGGSEIRLYRAADGLYGKLTFAEDEKYLAIVISTLDHGLDKPYVYDYLVNVYRDGKVESSFGNSHGFYDPDIYTSYCAPRAVFDGNTAELFIPYEYLSRFNVGSAYGEKGFMQITENSALKIAAAGESKVCAYNGEQAVFDILDPSTYAPLAVKEDV